MGLWGQFYHNKTKSQWPETFHNVDRRWKESHRGVQVEGLLPDVKTKTSRVICLLLLLLRRINKAFRITSRVGDLWMWGDKQSVQREFPCSVLTPASPLLSTLSPRTTVPFLSHALSRCQLPSARPVFKSWDSLGRCLTAFSWHIPKLLSCSDPPERPEQAPCNIAILCCVLHSLTPILDLRLELCLVTYWMLSIPQNCQSCCPGS